MESPVSKRYPGAHQQTLPQTQQNSQSAAEQLLPPVYTELRRYFLVVKTTSRPKKPVGEESSSMSVRALVIACLLLLSTLESGAEGAEPIDIVKLAGEQIRPEGIRAHVRFLADDLL